MDLELIAKLIWGGFIICWAIIRFRPNLNSRRTKKSVTARPLMERAAMVISSFGLGYIPAAYIFTDIFDGFNYTPNIVLMAIGATILLGSLWLFRVTHKALGRMWSHSLDLRKNHKLVTSGIYEKVRHPMYSAFWLWAIGAAFLLPNWIAGFSGLVGFGTLYFLRVNHEEEMMRSAFGSEYDSYCARTGRVFPKLG